MNASDGLSLVSARTTARPSPLRRVTTHLLLPSGIFLGFACSSTQDPEPLNMVSASGGDTATDTVHSGGMLNQMGSGGDLTSGSGGAGDVASGGAPSSGGASTDASGGSDSITGSGGAAPTSATYIPDPSWDCGMPEGIVDPELGELVFSVNVDIGEMNNVGLTQYGQRRFTDLKGGSIEGELAATFLPGGLDFELTLENGTVELEQVAMLRAADNSPIYMRSCGLAPKDATMVRFVPDFEAPNSSSVAWLNTGKFVGTRTLDEANKKMMFAVYDVSMVAVGDSKITWQDPSNVPHQPWECLKLTGTKGAAVLTEQVSLGGSISVGASKRGSRNVIPITGGTVSGELTGSVFPAGADYQLVSGSTVLDARYVLESNQGEFVIVRNCGPFGALVPLFEATDDGPFAFLNENRFLSSDPGVGGGGVSITFYELQ